METERGVTKVGIASLRTAVKKIVKHMDIKDDFLEILDFPVAEARSRSEWSSRRENTSSDPVQKFLAALGTPKKEKTPQELFMDFLSPKSGKTSEVCSHCGMTGIFLTLSSPAFHYFLSQVMGQQLVTSCTRNNARSEMVASPSPPALAHLLLSFLFEIFLFPIFHLLTPPLRRAWIWDGVEARCEYMAFDLSLSPPTALFFLS